MSTREGYAAALGAGLGMTFGMLFGAIAAGSTWTQGLATLGAGVLGLYIIARMIIEDGRLERELLHGGQPDDEEPERAPAMFRDTTRGTGTATTMPWRACNLQICRSAPARASTSARRQPATWYGPNCRSGPL